MLPEFDRFIGVFDPVATRFTDHHDVRLTEQSYARTVVATDITGVAKRAATPLADFVSSAAGESSSPELVGTRPAPSPLEGGTSPLVMPQSRSPPPESRPGILEAVLRPGVGDRHGTRRADTHVAGQGGRPLKAGDAGFRVVRSDTAGAMILVQGLKSARTASKSTSRCASGRPPSSGSPAGISAAERSRIIE